MSDSDRRHAQMEVLFLYGGSGWRSRAGSGEQGLPSSAGLGMRWGVKIQLGLFVSRTGVHFCQFKVAHKRRLSILAKAFPYETELQTYTYVKLSVYVVSWSLFRSAYKLLLCPYTKRRSTNSAEAVHHVKCRLLLFSLCIVGKPLVLEVGYPRAFVTLPQGPIHPL